MNFVAPLKRSYEDVTPLDEIELEFLKFAHYSNLWWIIVLQPEFKTQQITPERIVEGINLQFQTDITVQPEDMARYQAAHEQLAEMINQNEKTKAVWYDRGAGYCWKKISTEDGSW